MNEESEKKDSITEKLESVGQTIIGELEQIGGILTADPVSQAEGQLTEASGEAHFNAAEALEVADADEESE